jgi:hypothetical protein
MPEPVNGFTASREQVLASMAAAKSYIADSSAYQKCIGDFLAAAGSDRKHAIVALAAIENHRIAVSQRNQKKADDQVRMTIMDFNQYGSDCPG